jgi:hypothetical protein
MSVIRVGSTSMYADGWESIFGRGEAGGRRAKKKPGARTAKKKAVAKRAAKKPAKKAGTRR